MRLVCTIQALAVKLTPMQQMHQGKDQARIVRTTLPAVLSTL